MNKLTIGIVCTVLGLAVGAGGLYSITVKNSLEMDQISEEQPLYWVAPMDANYRRDVPGKSPMGMDLVPVYEQGNNTGEGIVSISPVVENNLGVRVRGVEMGILNSRIRTVGYVRFDEDKLVHMHPRVEGWIEALNVKTEGEYIQAGQGVYSIYSPTLVNAQEELVLALGRNNQRLIQSAEERLIALQVPQSLIEQIKDEKQVIQNITVFSPKDGLVAELGVREGQFVQPGNPIVSIGVLDEVWVIAEVFERQAGLVSVGDEVSMTLDYLPGRQWNGVVDFIYPTLDELTRTVSVRLRFLNPDQVLKPNMFAQVTIHSNQENTVLLVPNEAVIRSGSQDRVVLAIGEGSFKSVKVIIGRRGENNTEVLSGLQVGDRIVTSSHFLLDSESSIKSDFMRMDASFVMGAVSQEQSSSMNLSQAEQSSESDIVITMNSDEHEEMNMPDNDMSVTNDSVWIAGVVERKMSEQMMTVTHEPIPQWEWPTMTMMFEVAEGVDISDVEIGSTVEIEITRQEGGQIISGVRAPE